MIRDANKYGIFVYISEKIDKIWVTDKDVLLVFMAQMHPCAALKRGTAGVFFLFKFSLFFLYFML